MGLFSAGLGLTVTIALFTIYMIWVYLVVLVFFPVYVVSNYGWFGVCLIVF